MVGGGGGGTPVRRWGVRGAGFSDVGAVDGGLATTEGWVSSGGMVSGTGGVVSCDGGRGQ